MAFSGRIGFGAVGINFQQTVATFALQITEQFSFFFAIYNSIWFCIVEICDELSTNKASRDGLRAVRIESGATRYCYPSGQSNLASLAFSFAVASLCAKTIRWTVGGGFTEAANAVAAFGANSGSVIMTIIAGTSNARQTSATGLIWKNNYTFLGTCGNLAAVCRTGGRGFAEAASAVAAGFLGL